MKGLATDKTKGLPMAFALLRVVPVRMRVLFEALPRLLNASKKYYNNGSGTRFCRAS
jgi:hypothetical protein